MAHGLKRVQQKLMQPKLENAWKVRQTKSHTEFLPVNCWVCCNGMRRRARCDGGRSSRASG